MKIPTCQGFCAGPPDPAPHLGEPRATGEIKPLYGMEWVDSLLRACRRLNEGHPDHQKWIDEARAHLSAFFKDETLQKIGAESSAESHCHRCGGKNLVPWFSDSELWNQVMREGPGPELYGGIVCPICFAELAIEKGILSTGWRLIREEDALQISGERKTELRKELLRLKSLASILLPDPLALEDVRFFSDLLALLSPAVEKPPTPHGPPGISPTQPMRSFTKEAKESFGKMAAPQTQGGEEELAKKFHEIYQQEAKRQGDVRHKDAYEDLPENVKEFDRVLARYVLSILAPLERKAVSRAWIEDESYHLEWEDKDELRNELIPAMLRILGHEVEP